MFKYSITLYNDDIPITTYAREAQSDAEAIEIAKLIQATLVEVIERKLDSTESMRVVVENIEGNKIAEV